MAQEIFGFDAYAPPQVAERIGSQGLAKAALPAVTTFVLAVLAGAFIGLGALAQLLVASDASLSFGTSRLLGGLVFSLGLLLVLVAGAELFTGNLLLTLAWADGRLAPAALLRNWALVLAGNAVGAVGLAVLACAARMGDLGEGGLARQALSVAHLKASLPWDVALARALLCSVLVGLAVWMAAAGRSVADKAVAAVPPVATFVALGLEHSVANLFYFPFAIALRAQSLTGDPAGALHGADVIANLGVVIAGNVLGGAGLVALVYAFIYRRAKPDPNRPG